MEIASGKKAGKERQLGSLLKKLKKGDKIVLTSFGAGFIWGSVYLKWGYNPEDVQEIPETLNDTEDAE